MAEHPPAKKFIVPTTSQVRREYEVEAVDSEQAHSRLRTWLADEDAVRPGIVELKNEANTTDPQVKIQEITESNARRKAAPAEASTERAGGEES